MLWIVLGLVIIVALAFLVFLKAKVQGESVSLDYPYVKQEVLFSPAERSFLGVLTQAVGNEAQIFGKVRVADIITPKKGMPRSDWQKAFNKISGKHFDFILCDKDDLSILCVVELDDSSHNAKNRKERDLFLVGACKSSSVPLIQVPAKSTYNIGEIRELFSPYLGSRTSAASNKVHSYETPALEENLPIQDKSDRSCPKCSSLLVKRVAKKGNNAGNEFWACSSFPKCRYSIAVNA